MSTTARTNRAKMTARMERREAERKAEQKQKMLGWARIRMAEINRRATMYMSWLGYQVPEGYWDWSDEEQDAWRKANPPEGDLN